MSATAPVKTSRRYRVLHVIDSLDLGGAQVVVENLIKYGDREQFDFEVATMHGYGVFWERLKQLGVPLHSLSFHHKVPLYVPRLAAMCLLQRYDVVHTHLLASNVIAKPVAALCGVRVRINHDHCNDKLTDPRKWALPADKFMNRFSSHVIAVSESTRAFVLEHEGVSPDKATTIYNGIDLEKYRPRPDERASARSKLGIPEDAFVVAGIGRLTFQKNFTLFLEVAADVLKKNPQAVFVIAGTGEDETALKAKADELGISSKVHFLGMVSDTSALYPAADILLLTSRYEGLPITILEAMATSVAIVASNLDGMREILRDGENAALVLAEDSAQFVQRVCELIEQPALKDKLAVAALEAARQKYCARTMAGKVEEIYARYLRV